MTIKAFVGYSKGSSPIVVFLKLFEIITNNMIEADLTGTEVGLSIYQ